VLLPPLALGIRMAGSMNQPPQFNPGASPGTGRAGRLTCVSFLPARQTRILQSCLIFSTFTAHTLYSAVWVTGSKAVLVSQLAQPSPEMERKARVQRG
jgi:hypothetical protein